MDFGGGTFESQSQFPTIDRSKLQRFRVATPEEVKDVARRFLLYTHAVSFMQLLMLLVFFLVSNTLKKAFRFFVRRFVVPGRKSKPRN